eukprot:m.206811 g.206811  ORF g.206811 m.206811 type:complete len:139 (+) comp39681_c0_seq4:350-766(+)
MATATTLLVALSALISFQGNLLVVRGDDDTVKQLEMTVTALKAKVDTLEKWMSSKCSEGPGRDGSPGKDGQKGDQGLQGSPGKEGCPTDRNTPDLKLLRLGAPRQDSNFAALPMLNTFLSKIQNTTLLTILLLLRDLC